MIVVECCGDLGCRQVLLTGESGEERVVPVPPIQRGMRDQIVKTGPEGDGRDEDRDREDRAKDGRTNRCCIRAIGFQGESQPRRERERDS